MEGYTRSRSYNGDNKMSMEPYERSYSVTTPRNLQLDKRKESSGSSSSSHKHWSLTDSEGQRKKRVAGYKMYTVEGKVKGSLKKSFRWIKDRYIHAVDGWW